MRSPGFGHAARQSPLCGAGRSGGGLPSESQGASSRSKADEAEQGSARLLEGLTLKEALRVSGHGARKKAQGTRGMCSVAEGSEESGAGGGRRVVFAPGQPSFSPLADDDEEEEEEEEEAEGEEEGGGEERLRMRSKTQENDEEASGGDGEQREVNGTDESSKRF